MANRRFAGQYHATVLALAAIVVFLSPALQLSGPEQLTLRGLPNLPLPQTCLSRRVLGVECPGCGLTRSLVHLTHGHWRASVGAHRLGWLVMAALVLQFPYRLLAFWRRDDWPLGRRLPTLFAAGLAAVLVVNWVVGFLR